MKKKKIIIYCQHVLGVGHFFRTLELVKAMDAFEAILVTGGDSIEADLPDHVRQVKLPGLMMDENFTGLHSVNPQLSVEEVKKVRKEKLLDLFIQEQPDLFLIELYPFGRRAFRFELVPVLEYIKSSPGVNCKVCCSLRDILVEKKDIEKYENRVIKALNNWFDAVLIHSDPQLIALDATFTRLDQIDIPLVYTGFVTPLPDPDHVRVIRERAGVKILEPLIVASVGGGNVGAKLLRAVVQAHKLLPKDENFQLQVYTGPYMDKKDKDYLKSFVDDKIMVEEFSSEFVSLLGAADLSISMGGYNTCMNIVAAKTASLVWPFGQNSEQRERVQKLAQFVPMTLIENDDLVPEKLCEMIKEICVHSHKNKGNTLSSDCGLNMDGAKQTAQWIGDFIKN